MSAFSNVGECTTLASTSRSDQTSEPSLLAGGHERFEVAGGANVGWYSNQPFRIDTGMRDERFRYGVSDDPVLHQDTAFASLNASPIDDLSYSDPEPPQIPSTSISTSDTVQDSNEEERLNSSVYQECPKHRLPLFRRTCIPSAESQVDPPDVEALSGWSEFIIKDSDREDSDRED